MTQMSRTEFKELYRSRKDFVPPLNELRELGLDPIRDSSILTH